MKLFYIGSGPISNFHIPALKSVGFNITGIATRLNSKRCEEFSLKHGLREVYEKGGWEEGLKNNNFDCIVLAVDTKYTPDILNKIMHYEIPILVEKPVGWHPIQLEKLIESNPSGAQKVMVAYNRRYYKIVNLLKDYIDNNDQGLITISIPDSISSIRQFLVNGCHMVDLLCYLMPELTLNYCKCNLKSDGNISSIVGLAITRYEYFSFTLIFLIASFIIFLSLLLILFLLTALPIFFFVTKLIFNFFSSLLDIFLKKIVKYLFEIFFPLRIDLKSSFLERLVILLFIKL